MKKENLTITPWTTTVHVPVSELSDEKRDVVQGLMEREVDRMTKDILTSPPGPWVPPPIPLEELVGWLIDEDVMFERKRIEARKRSGLFHLFPNGMDTGPIFIDPVSITRTDIT